MKLCSAKSPLKDFILLFLPLTFSANETQQLYVHLSVSSWRRSDHGYSSVLRRGFEVVQV